MPDILVDHFLDVIKQLEAGDWKHYAPIRSRTLRVTLDDVKDQEEYDMAVEPLWLGPNRIRRNLLHLRDNIICLFRDYKIARIVPLVAGVLGEDFAVNGYTFTEDLLTRFPKEKRKRGRKPSASSTSSCKVGSKRKRNEHELHTIRLEGITNRKDVAVLIKWKDLPDAKSTWHLLSIQDPQLVEWWSEISEFRYPLIPKAEYRVPIRRAGRGFRAL